MPRVALLCLCVLSAQPAAAQDVDLDALVTFYGDNTEFSNSFREGETILGSFAQVFVEARLSDRLAVRAGAFGNQRFGSTEAFDQARPALAIVIGGPRSRLILGTIETMRHVDGSGPDRTGLHGLLPPMQRETLVFDRPWEAGLQWTVNAARLSSEVWIDWQRLNTRHDRELFDAGISSRLRLRRALTMRADAHVVHQGGQLADQGVVADSTAAAVGVEAAAGAGSLDRVSLEGAAVVSRFVPDRERPERSRTGVGAFLRTSAEKAGWRVHGILWRASDVISAEGDRHYHALRRDGTEFRALRDYVEAGLTRTFRLAPASFVEASVRWHLVEGRDEYSFRILAVASLRAPLHRQEGSDP